MPQLGFFFFLLNFQIGKKLKFSTLSRFPTYQNDENVCYNLYVPSKTAGYLSEMCRSHSGKEDKFLVSLAKRYVEEE